MKKVAGKLKLDLAQYRELAAFAQFSSDLDETTKKQLDRGQRVTEIMKQGWDNPYPVEKQVVIIYATTNGYLDDVPVTEINRFENEFLKFMDQSGKKVLDSIVKLKEIDEKTEKELIKLIDQFKNGWTSLEEEKVKKESPPKAD